MKGIDFRREGDGFVLTNGPLELSGEICEGRLVRNVKVDGQEIGCVDVGLKCSNDGKTWEWPTVLSLADVRFGETADAAVLDLWGEWWKKTGAWQIDGLAWRTHVRLEIAPGARRFRVEFVEFLNNGTKPLVIARPFFHVYPPSGQKPVRHVGALGGANADAWTVGGRAFGLSSACPGVQKITFWTDVKSDCPHPDCGFDLPTGTLRLEPWQSCPPPRPLFAEVFGE